MGRGEWGGEGAVVVSRIVPAVSSNFECDLYSYTNVRNNILVQN